MRILAFIVLGSVASLLPVGHATGTAPPLGLHLAPCVQGKAKVPARCGTFGVYENRQRRSGRIIELHVILVPAKGSNHHVIASIAGGPGEAATEFAPAMLAGDFGKARQTLMQHYDHLFMDDRGMGQSAPLNCDLTPAPRPDIYFRWLFAPKVVAACRAISSKTHDLSQYNTANTVDDLDDLRAALGYPKIILDGGSYGTFFSMVYLRRHPQHAESAILDGVTAPGFQPLPGSPDGAQRALDDLFGKCRTDAVCRAHFPSFQAHFEALLQRFNRSPIQVPAMNPTTKRLQTVALTKEVFVDQIRHVLYAPEGAAYLPYVTERAFRGDYAPLATMVQTAAVGIDSDLAMGANLSYTCADWMPFITPAQMAAARAHSFAGDLRIRGQQQACRIWNVPPMPPQFNDPVRSSVPVLMILGSDDPATPPEYSLKALAYLPNGRAILVHGAGHGADNDCTDKQLLLFLRRDSAEGLDLTHCSAAFKLPPFATSMKGWP